MIIEDQMVVIMCNLGDFLTVIFHVKLNGCVAITGVVWN